MNLDETGFFLTGLFRFRFKVDLTANGYQNQEEVFSGLKNGMDRLLVELDSGFQTGMECKTRRVLRERKAKTMSLSDQEKEIIAQSLQLYVQYSSQQLPQAQVRQLLGVVQGIMQKLDHLQAGNADPGEPPAGISEEWYSKVCRKCPQLGPTGCNDKITQKFPGKCDPILKYERNKNLQASP